MGYVLVIAVVMIAIALFFKPRWLEFCSDFVAALVSFILGPLYRLFKTDESRHSLSDDRYYVRQRQYVREYLKRA